MDISDQIPVLRKKIYDDLKVKLVAVYSQFAVLAITLDFTYNDKQFFIRAKNPDNNKTLLRLHVTNNLKIELFRGDGKTSHSFGPSEDQALSNALYAIFEEADSARKTNS